MKKLLMMHPRKQSWWLHAEVGERTVVVVVVEDYDLVVVVVVVVVVVAAAAAAVAAGAAVVIDVVDDDLVVVGSAVAPGRDPRGKVGRERTTPQKEHDFPAADVAVAAAALRVLVAKKSK